MTITKFIIKEYYKNNMGEEQNKIETTNNKILKDKTHIQKLKENKEKKNSYETRSKKQE